MKMYNIFKKPRMSVSDRKEPGAGKVQNLCGSCLHLFNCALGVGEGKKENVS